MPEFQANKKCHKPIYIYQIQESSVPIILPPEILETETESKSWTKTTLADDKSIGTSAIAAFRWSFKPMAMGPENKHGDADQLLYVISGNGTVRVNGDSLPLEKETLLWLEQGDVYQFYAGEDGLEILQGYAPGV
jgi:quercetin dioxygenase-like cupin family protein